MSRINRSRNEAVARRELVRRMQDMQRQNKENLQTGSVLKPDTSSSNSGMQAKEKTDPSQKGAAEKVGNIQAAGNGKEGILTTDEKQKNEQYHDQDIQTLSGGGGGKSAPTVEKEHDYGPEKINITEKGTIKTNVESAELKYASNLVSGKYIYTNYDGKTRDRFNNNSREKSAVLVRGYDLGPSVVNEKKTIMDRVPIFDENGNLSYASYFYTYSPKKKEEKEPEFSPYFISILPANANDKPTGNIPLYTKGSSEEKPSVLQIASPNISASELSKDYPGYQERLIGFFLEKKVQGGYTGYLNVGSAIKPLYYFISFAHDTGGYSMYSAGFVFIGKTFNTDIPTLSDTQRQMSMGEFINEDVKKNPVRGKTLGKITGLNTIASREERLRVNYYINLYFNQGESNATINQIIPIGNNKPIYYKLDFTTNNISALHTVDVKVTRIGDENDVKRADPEYERVYDIQDIKGYGAHATSKDKFIEWLTKHRYKNISAQEIGGSTIKDVRLNMKNQIKSKAGDPASKWFELNYGIKIFYTKADAEAGYNAFVNEKNQKSEDIPTPQEQAEVKKRIIPFTDKDQLLKLEAALHRLDESVFTLLQNTTFFRQSIHIDEVKNGIAVEKESTNGFTRTNPNTGISIVAIYNSAFENEQFTFFGGNKDKITSYSSGTMLHEIAHVVGESVDPKAEIKGTKYKASFYDYIDKNSIDPITDYGRSDNTKKANTPEKRSEFWADAFLIYHTDPAWLNSYHPKVSAWFTSRF